MVDELFAELFLPGEAVAACVADAREELDPDEAVEGYVRVGVWCDGGTEADDAADAFVAADVREFDGCYGEAGGVGGGAVFGVQICDGREGLFP